MTGVYNPKTFILHAALHHQGCPHCELFSTAATRRCLDRVSVPVCLIVLSDQVPVVALVSRYLTNKLIGREPILQRQPYFHKATFNLAIPWGINPSFPGLSPSAGHVIHVLLTRAPLNYSCIATQIVPCDLHVLNTPPAFVLSQNQTLRKKFGWRIPLIKKEPYSKLTLAKPFIRYFAVSARLSTKARSAQFNLSSLPGEQSPRSFSNPLPDLSKIAACHQATLSKNYFRGD